MKISKSSVWVFDLDDTLYPEREYQLSGYHYIADHLQRLYQRNVLDLMLDADSNGKDVLQEVCLALSLPDSVKQSLLWMYRLHVPTITLDPDIKSAIEMIQSSCTALAIITDGRSISQRNKLLSLGLDAIDTLVSEEWGESKPGEKRFQEVEKRYSGQDQYIYVGDNLKKDFVTPNKMNWLTIGVRESGSNIHPQNISQFEATHLPSLWIDSVSELQEYVC